MRFVAYAFQVCHYSNWLDVETRVFSEWSVCVWQDLALPICLCFITLNDYLDLASFSHSVSIFVVIAKDLSYSAIVYC